MMSSVCDGRPRAVIMSDASHLWGLQLYGAVVSAAVATNLGMCPHHIQRARPSAHGYCSVGPPMTRGHCQCRSDNAAVVSIVESGKSEKKLAMHLMRTLFVCFFLYSLLPARGGSRTCCREQ